MICEVSFFENTTFLFLLGVDNLGPFRVCDVFAPVPAREVLAGLSDGRQEDDPRALADSKSKSLVAERDDQLSWLKSR